MDRTNTPALTALPGHCWSQLTQGARSARHPFRTGVLATAADGDPAARTVVLRESVPAERWLWFHTDRRSAKVRELSHNARFTWLFWDATAQEQLRCSGLARLDANEAQRNEQWQQLGPRSQALYALTAPPGHALETLEENAVSPERPEPVCEANPHEHFLAVRCVVTAMDWLRLDPAGHRRAHLHWNANAWDASWVGP